MLRPTALPARCQPFAAGPLPSAPRLAARRAAVVVLAPPLQAKPTRITDFVALNDEEIVDKVTQLKRSLVDMRLRRKADEFKNPELEAPKPHDWKHVRRQVRLHGRAQFYYDSSLMNSL